MNRQEMLDAITHKIARTGGGTGPGETGYYLPVMIGDVLDYWDFEGTEYVLLELWKSKREPLDRQSEDCITYIYNLL